MREEGAQVIFSNVEIMNFAHNMVDINCLLNSPVKYSYQTARWKGTSGKNIQRKVTKLPPLFIPIY